MATRPAMIAYEDRTEPRDETLYRARLRDTGGEVRLATIVNLSPNGFMARSEDEIGTGDKVVVTLPVVGDFTAEVRWALGGRIGCKLSHEIAPTLYQFVLAAMR